MARFFNTKKIKKKLAPKKGVSAKRAFTQARSNPQQLQAAVKAAALSKLQRRLAEINRGSVQSTKAETLKKISGGKGLPVQTKKEPFNANDLLKSFVKQKAQKAQKIGKSATQKVLDSGYYKSQKPGIDFIKGLVDEREEEIAPAFEPFTQEEIDKNKGDSFSEKLKKTQESPRAQGIAVLSIDAFDPTGISNIGKKAAGKIAGKVGKEAVEQTTKKTAKKAAKEFTPNQQKIADSLDLDLSKIDQGQDQLIKEQFESTRKGIQGYTPTSKIEKGLELVGDPDDLARLSNKKPFVQGEVPRKSLEYGKSPQGLAPTHEVLDQSLKTSDKISDLIENTSTLAKKSQQNISKSGVSDAKGIRGVLRKLQGGKEAGEKLNLLDALKTPQRVFERVGLGEQVDNLRKAETMSQLSFPKEMQRVKDFKLRADAIDTGDTPLRIFQRLDGDEGVKLSKPEEKIALDIKAYYKEWAERLGIPEEGRITNYVTHIFEKGDTLDEFPAEIAKMINGKISKSVYNPFQLKRKGKTDDLIRNPFLALEAYVKRANRKSFMDPALKDFEKGVRKNVDDIDMINHAEKFVSGINYRPTAMDRQIDNGLKGLMGGFAPNRPTAKFTRAFRKLIYWGTITAPKSALKNLTQGVNTFAQLGTRYTADGYARMVADLKKGKMSELVETGVLENSFVENSLVSATSKRKQIYNKTEDIAFSSFQAAERVNRGAAYFGAKQKALGAGASMQEAIQEGVDMARKTQFTFGAVDTPVALQGDIAKTVLQFQSYNIKQLEFISDLLKAPKNAYKNKGFREAAKEAMPLLRYIGGTAVMMGIVGQYLGFTDWRSVFPAVDIGASPAVKIGQAGFDKVLGNEYERENAGEDLAKNLKTLIPGKVQAERLAQTYKSQGGELPEFVDKLFGSDKYEKGMKMSSGGFKEYDVPQNAQTAALTSLLGMNSLKARVPIADIAEKTLGGDTEGSSAQKSGEYNFFDATEEYEKIWKDFKDEKISKDEARQQKEVFTEKAKAYDLDGEYISEYVRKGDKKEESKEARKDAYLMLNSLRDEYPNKSTRDAKYKQMVESGEISQDVHKQIRFLVDLEKQKQ